MADLLHRLAARTLGRAPTVTPRVPTWYESSPDPSTVDVEAPASTVDSVRPAPLTGQSTPAPAGATVTRAPFPAGTRMVVGESRAPRQPTMPVRAAPATAVPVALPVAAAGEPPRPAAPAAPAVPPDAAVTAVTALPPMPPPPPAAAPSPRRAAAQARPDVHITIGRIEVRAETPAQPAAAPQPAPAAHGPRPAEPAVLTLSAYLRGDDGRPR